MNSIKREQATRLKARDLLLKEGWTSWWPSRPCGKFKFSNSSTDILGKFDLIAVPTDPEPDRLVTLDGDVFVTSLRLIQLKTNHDGQIDQKYLTPGYGPLISQEFWSYSTTKREFLRARIDDEDVGLHLTLLQLWKRRNPRS